MDLGAFANLSTDVLGHIIEYCDVRTIIALAATSRDFHAAILGPIDYYEKGKWSECDAAPLAWIWHRIEHLLRYRFVTHIETESTETYIISTTTSRFSYTPTDRTSRGAYSCYIIPKTRTNLIDSAVGLKFIVFFVNTIRLHLRAVYIDDIKSLRRQALNIVGAPSRIHQYEHAKIAAAANHRDAYRISLGKYNDNVEYQFEILCLKNNWPHPPDIMIKLWLATLVVGPNDALSSVDTTSCVAVDDQSPFSFNVDF